MKVEQVETTSVEFLNDLKGLLIDIVSHLQENKIPDDDVVSLSIWPDSEQDWRAVLTYTTVKVKK